MDDEEKIRRVRAAVAYYGTQAEFGKELHRRDIGGLRDPEQVIQGNKKFRQRDANAFSEVSGFAIEWFTDEAAGPRAVAGVLAELLAGLSELQTAVAELRIETAAIRSQLGHGERNPGAADDK